VSGFIGLSLKKLNISPPKSFHAKFFRFSDFFIIILFSTFIEKINVQNKRTYCF